jgi:hypothetical protein
MRFLKVGDLVKEVTLMNRKPDVGLILETDFAADEGCVMYLVHFDDDEACWMAEHHLKRL